jgi:hypothetical protein
MRRKRSDAASLDYIFHGFFRTGEQSLNRPIAPVTYPACEAVLNRMLLYERAETDALHPTANHDVANDMQVIAHALSPTSIARAPVQRDCDQHSTERT